MQFIYLIDTYHFNTRNKISCEKMFPRYYEISFYQKKYMDRTVFTKKWLQTSIF